MTTLFSSVTENGIDLQLLLDEGVKGAGGGAEWTAAMPQLAPQHSSASALSVPIARFAEDQLPLHLTDEERGIIGKDRVHVYWIAVMAVCGTTLVND